MNQKYQIIKTLGCWNDRYIQVFVGVVHRRRDVKMGYDRGTRCFPLYFDPSAREGEVWRISGEVSCLASSVPWEFSSRSAMAVRNLNSVLSYVWENITLYYPQVRKQSVHISTAFPILIDFFYIYICIKYFHSS